MSNLGTFFFFFFYNYLHDLLGLEQNFYISPQLTLFFIIHNKCEENYKNIFFLFLLFWNLQFAIFYFLFFIYDRNSNLNSHVRIF